MPDASIVALNAMPVTIPGRAIGSTNRNEIASRPKNVNRWRASAARVPSTMATAVATRPTWMDSPSASRRSSFSKATPNQSVVKFSIGQVCARDSLNAYRAMTAMGRYRKPRTPSVASRIAIATQSGRITAIRTRRAGARRGGRRAMITIGTSAYAAANGTLFATPWLSKTTLPMNCVFAMSCRRHVVAEGEREREDRARGDGRAGPAAAPPAGTSSSPARRGRRGLEHGRRDALEAGVDRQDHVRQPEIAERRCHTADVAEPRPVWPNSPRNHSSNPPWARIIRQA